MNSCRDERITAQVHKIGNESFFILIGMLFLTMIYKTVTKNASFRGVDPELILITVSCGYYTLRCIIAGVYITPSSTKNRSRFTKSLLLWLGIGAIVWGLFLAIRNMFLFQGGVFSWLTVSVFLISSISFFIILIISFTIIYSISGFKSRRSHEE